MLREEFQRGNYEQALGLAERGLNEASKVMINCGLTSLL